ncbi:MAG: LytTR family DNA-binding domain-containing protein [Muribaculaceae bacterium]|nr:LytTR family DNA-binding domain-containing protein [Muribaculaceae bacterium]MDE6756658.1 LytTR family DNA-binding domain-containing protein [Muribaculaceae bacterium]
MIKCVAIDDEPIALSIIKEYCSRYGDVKLECFTSPISGMECIRTTRPDIVFLDIEMNSHNGVALARELPEGTCLIFTTAYANYAIDGFNVDAVDFLHKPIFYPRFEKAMEKARKYLRVNDDRNIGDTITLKVEHKNVVININDIIVVEAMDNYVKIYRKDLPTVISQITMKELETMLPANIFTRVHRSFIVSLRFIEKYSNRMICLHNHTRTIPVGRKYLSVFNSLTDMLHNSNSIQTN